MKRQRGNLSQQKNVKHRKQQRRYDRDVEHSRSVIRSWTGEVGPDEWLRQRQAVERET